MKNNNWSLHNITKKIVEEFKMDYFKDLPENGISEKIRTKYKDKITNNTFEEQDNIKETIWIFREDNEIPEIKKNDEEILYNFSEIKDNEELKDFEINNSELLNLPKYKNLLNIQEYITMYKKLISICQALPFSINKLDDKKSSEIFNTLYSIYLLSQNYEKSILEIEIKNYQKAFQYLCNILQKCDVDLTHFQINIIEEKANLQNSLIEHSNPLLFNIPKNQWFTKKDQKKKENTITNVNLQNLERDNDYSPYLFSNQENNKQNKAIETNKKKKIL